MTYILIISDKDVVRADGGPSSGGHEKRIGSTDVHFDYLFLGCDVISLFYSSSSRWRW